MAKKRRDELPATPANHDATRRSASFAEAFRFWLKLGFISFGGPAGQIAIMHRELVERRRWISEGRFLHALNYCMLLPGPEAQQLATYIGWLLHGVKGGLAAGSLFVLPSVGILLGLSYAYVVWGSVPAVAGVLAGFKPVVVAIVTEAVLRIGRRALRTRILLLIAATAFLSLYFLQVPFPLIVLSAAILGFAGARFLPQGKQGRASAAAKATESADHLASGEESTFVDHPSGASGLATRRMMRIATLALALWTAPLVALVLWRGWESVHRQQYLFFSQAALVTFGGAYAVLGYVLQAAVSRYGWLTETQALDGLALAETTPGPLIMVLQFVGFLGGWNQPGSLSPAYSAVLAALVTTYTTFLPSFVFIFLGAPYVEQLRGNLKLQAALSGVTAAVVGVILNLALVFGAAVIWPDGWAGGVDRRALLLTPAAFVALYFFKADVVWVILAGGFIGLGWELTTRV